MTFAIASGSVHNISEEKNDFVYMLKHILVNICQSSVIYGTYVNFAMLLRCVGTKRTNGVYYICMKRIVRFAKGLSFQACVSHLSWRLLFVLWNASKRFKTKFTSECACYSLKPVAFSNVWLASFLLLDVWE